MEDQTYYNVLQLSSDCSPTAIKLAFQNLAKKCHPDRAKMENTQQNLDMKTLNKAYAILKNPILRQEYDATLNKNEAKFIELKANSQHFLKRMDTIKCENVIEPIRPMKPEPRLTCDEFNARIQEYEIARAQEYIESMPDKTEEKISDREYTIQISQPRTTGNDDTDLFESNGDVLPYNSGSYRNADEIFDAQILLEDAHIIINDNSDK